MEASPGSTAGWLLSFKSVMICLLVVCVCACVQNNDVSVIVEDSSMLRNYYFCGTARSRLLGFGQQDAVLQSGGAGVFSRPSECCWAQSGPAVTQPALGTAMELLWAWTSSQAQLSWKQWVAHSQHNDMGSGRMYESGYNYNLFSHNFSRV